MILINIFNGQVRKKCQFFLAKHSLESILHELLFFIFDPVSGDVGKLMIK